MQDQIHLILLRLLKQERQREVLRPKQFAQHLEIKLRYLVKLHEVKQPVALIRKAIVQRDHLHEETVHEVHLRNPQEIVTIVDQEVVVLEVHLDLQEVVV